jgi:hypothetical protein
MHVLRPTPVPYSTEVVRSGKQLDGLVRRRQSVLVQRLYGGRVRKSSLALLGAGQKGEETTGCRSYTPDSSIAATRLAAAAAAAAAATISHRKEQGRAEQGRTRLGQPEADRRPALPSRPDDQAPRNCCRMGACLFPFPAAYSVPCTLQLRRPHTLPNGQGGKEYG